MLVPIIFLNKERKEEEMLAKKRNLSREELSEMLKISTQFFGSTPSIKEEIEREIESEVNSLLVENGLRVCSQHTQEMTPIELEQSDGGFIEFNSVKTLRYA